MRNKAIIILLMSLIGILFQSCETEPTVVGNNLYFRAVNLSVDSDRENGAKSYGPFITTTVTVTYAVNGKTNSQSFSSTSNELFVLPGNEIEITFYPSCEEEAEAVISLPDGSKHKVTAMNPTFKWIVPNDFSDKMEIIGESHYVKKGSECFERGIIVLTPII